MKIAVVGLGYWGPNLVRNFLSVDGVEGVIACDVSTQRLDNIRKKFPTVEVTGSFDEILKRDDVAGVVLATPVATHYPLGLRALEAGKHLLIEKPMTQKTSEAEHLLEVAYARMLTLMIDHTFVYTSSVQKIKELIVTDKVGRVLYFDAVQITLGLFQHDTGVMWDLAPHDLSIMDYLIDENPIAVSCLGVAYFNEFEDLAYLTVHYAEKLIAQFHINWLSPAKAHKILLGGTKLMVVYDDVEPSEKVKVYDKGIDVLKSGDFRERFVRDRIGDVYVPNIDSVEALGRLAAEFVDCIQTGKPSVADGQAGLNVVKILEAAGLSLKSGGRRVELAHLSRAHRRPLAALGK